MGGVAMAEKYDVVVVGAGPAGLMTARTAGEGGLRIALLERRTDISKSRRTDGGVVALDEYLIGQVVRFNRETQTLVFPVSGFSLKYDGPRNHHRYGFHLYSPGGKRFMVGDWAELKKDPEKNSRGIALSRGRFLHGILAEVQAKGVEYFPNTNAVGVTTAADGATVHTDKGDYEGKFIVAADGINSRIVRSLGLNKKRKFLGTTRYLTWTMTGVRPPDAEGLIFVYTMYGTFSIMQICDEDHSHVGILNSDPKVELEFLLKRFTGEDPVFSPWFKGAKRVGGAESCVVNGWEAIEKPYYKNVVLVGDACWCEQFAHPPSLSAGHELGHALTRAFIDEKFNEEGVAQYLEWYGTKCYKPYGSRAMGAGGSISDYLAAEELDYLAALPGKPAPHTASFYRLFTTIFETYQPLVPRIKEERPEIMKKFKEMGGDMEKAREKRRRAGFPNK
jgi:flavin-dependent dehydrogenase